METVAAIGLGLALAIDASVVAFSCGLSAKRHNLRCPLKLAVVTGALQGLMPIFGFFAAGSITRHIVNWAPWLSFTIFVLLGLTFIRNAWKKSESHENCGCGHCAIRSWNRVFAVGVATSIDALAVGVGIACAADASRTDTSLFGKIFLPAILIAGTTFICVLAAFYATRFFHRYPEKILGTIAGLILIALGINAL